MLVKRVALRWFPVIAVLVVIMVLTPLAIYCFTMYSPTAQEPPLVAAGILQWRCGRYDLYCVNPPLLKGVVGFIGRGTKTEIDCDVSYYLGTRPEFSLGDKLVRSRKDWLQTDLFFIRWCGLAFLVLLVACSMMLVRWFAVTMSTICLLLISFDPLFFAHGTLVSNDIAAASTAVAATFTGITFIRKPSIWNAILVGGMIGVASVAELSNLSLLLFSFVWLIITSRNRKAFRDYAAGVIQFIFLWCAAIYVINVSYEFKGSFSSLGSYTFCSQILSGQERGGIGNRFVGTFIEKMPVPFPSDFIKGLDLQKRDFEFYPVESYLLGEWRAGGWWYYYLYGMLVKVPHVTQLVMLTGLAYFAYRLFCWLFRIATRFDDSKATVPDLIVLITPALALFALVSSQDEFSIHFRYVFPCFPFFIILGCIALFDLFRSQRSRNILLAIVILSSLNNLRHFPHFIPYFNELSGGPANGWKHMLGSSYDWGQDMLFIKDYLKEHNIPIDEVRVTDHGYRYWECIYPDIWQRQKGPFKYDLVSANTLTRPEKDYLKRLEAGEATRICYTAWLFPIKDESSPGTTGNDI